MKRQQTQHGTIPATPRWHHNEQHEHKQSTKHNQPATKHHHLSHSPVLSCPCTAATLLACGIIAMCAFLSFKCSRTTQIDGRPLRKKGIQHLTFACDPHRKQVDNVSFWTNTPRTQKSWNVWMTQDHLNRSDVSRLLVIRVLSVSGVLTRTAGAVRATCSSPRTRRVADSSRTLPRGL